MMKEHKEAGRVLLTAFIFVFIMMMPQGASSEMKPFIEDSEQFHYARTLFDAGEYRVCIREFSRLIEQYPASPYIPEAQFKLAQSYLNAGLNKEAASEFRRFLENYPTSPLAVDARNYAQEAKRNYDSERLYVKGGAAYSGRAEKLRAAQIMLFDSKTDEELTAEVARLKAAGINTVIVRVFHNSGDRYHGFASPRASAGVYFATGSAPVVDDVLRRVIKAAKPAGMRVFAWMTTRYADYGIENDESLACMAWDVAAQSYARCKGLDLFNEAAVRRLEGIYSDLASYEIDGVLFQDDLVLRYNEGFGAKMRALYKKETGESIVPSDLYLPATGGEAVRYTDKFWKWAVWKNKRLLGVAARLREVVRAKRPNARFAINLMYESVTNPAGALAWLSQSFDAAVRSGFDYFSVMAYHRQMEQELGCDAATAKRMIDNIVERASAVVKDRARLLVKFQTVDWKTGKQLPDREVTGLVRAIKGLKNASLAVVPYRADFPFNDLVK